MTEAQAHPERARP